MARTDLTHGGGSKRKRNMMRQVVFACPGCRTKFSTVESLSKHCKSKLSKRICRAYAYRTIRDLEKSCRRVVEVEDPDEKDGDSGERLKRRRADSLDNYISTEKGDSEQPKQKRKLDGRAVEERGEQQLTLRFRERHDGADDRNGAAQEEDDNHLSLRSLERNGNAEQDTGSGRQENQQYLGAGLQSEDDRDTGSEGDASDPHERNADLEAADHHLQSDGHQTEYEYNGHSSFMLEDEAVSSDEEEEGAEDQSFPNSIDFYTDFNADEVEDAGEGPSSGSGEQSGSESVASADNADFAMAANDETFNESDSEGEELDDESEEASLPYPNYSPEDHDDGYSDANDSLIDQVNFSFGNLTPANSLKRSRQRLRTISTRRAIPEPVEPVESSKIESRGRQRPGSVYSLGAQALRQVAREKDPAEDRQWVRRKFGVAGVDFPAKERKSRSRRMRR